MSRDWDAWCAGLIRHWDPLKAFSRSAGARDAAAESERLLAGHSREHCIRGEEPQSGGAGGAVLFLSFSGVRPKVGTATATRVPGDVPHPRGTPCDL